MKAEGSAPQLATDMQKEYPTLFKLPQNSMSSPTGNRDCRFLSGDGGSACLQRLRCHSLWPYVHSALTIASLCAADMNLGDAPQGLASAPAPAAEIAAAIAAEEAPTPQEQAVSNPVTNVLSALLTGRRLQQQPQQPQAQQPAAGAHLRCCCLVTLLSGRHDALSHTRLQFHLLCK